MKDFRKVWERAHELTLELYRMTGRFPREELFGLTSQIRRCSASIGANIAEGCGKRGNAEFQRFLQIASGSANELDYHLLLAHDLNLITRKPHCRRSCAHQKMLTSLLQKVEAERLGTKC